MSSPLGRNGAIALVAVLGVALLAHGPALWGGFLYDDFNDVIRNPSALAESFVRRVAVMSRPVLKASYALQDALHGPWAAGYHAVNLVLHLVAAGLVLMLLRRAAALAGQPEAAALWIGALAAGLWAAHPATVDAVGQVAGRSAVLSGVLVLGAIGAATAPRARPLLAASCAALAPLARETALVAPLLLLVWHLCLVQPDRLRRAVPVWLGAGLAGCVLLALPRHRDLLAFSLALRDPIDALRGNLFAVTEMLRLWLEPWQIGAVPAQPVIHGWTDAPTIARLGGLGLAGLAALGLRRVWPLGALAVLWTAVALAPTNSLIWRVDPVAMRPFHLAGIGLALGLAAILAHGPVGRGLAVALILGLAGLTARRAALLTDPVALFADAAAKAPGTARPLVLMGMALANAGDPAGAEAAFQAALAVDPSDDEAANALRLLAAGALIYSPAPP